MQLRKHFMQRAKQAANNLAKVASIERLRNRIIAPSNSTSSDEEYMDVINEDINIPQTVVLENSENGREQGVHNEEQGVHEQGVHNEDVIEALDLSEDEDDEIVLQDEVDHEDDASEDSDDYDEDINENLFETEEQKANYVAENLREWAIYEGSISKKKLDNLLHRLNPVFPTLPKSYKTLLRTPKHLDVYVLSDGSKLWYKGIVRNLDAMLLHEYLGKYNNITIDINMDELPVTKSTRLKFWPVLGRLVHTDNDPFLIGLYVGEWDPVDVHSYLHDFVVEAEPFRIWIYVQ